jgi:hypothetical protein
LGASSAKQPSHKPSLKRQNHFHRLQRTPSDIQHSHAETLNSQRDTLRRNKPFVG